MGLKVKNQFLLFWSILGALGVLLIWNLPWRFQVNDDVIMMWLVSGAFTGKPEPYAVFIHPLLSWIFSKFYSWCPGFNWYGVSWFFVIAFSYFLLIYRISALSYHLLTKSFLAFLLLLISLHFCIFPQFTLIAGFAAFSALSVWFSEESPSKLVFRSLAMLLFVVSILIRWESAVLIGLGFGLFVFMTGGFSYFKVKRKQFLPFVFLFLALLGGKWIWEKNSEYAEFLKFNKIRAGVLDHPVFREEIIDGKIPSNSDFFFFSRWYFEGEHPSIEELERKKTDLDSRYFSVDQVLNSFLRFWKFQKVEAFKSFLILWILLLLFLSARKSPVLIKYFLLWMIFFFTFNHFFILQGRVIFLFFLSLMFPLVSRYLPNLPRKPMFFSFFICVLAFGYHGMNFLKEARGREIMDSEFSGVLSELDRDTPLIFEGYQEHNLGLHFSSTNPVPFISTGWTSRSVFQEKALNRFGLGGFEDLRRFALLTPKTNTEIVFPSYMNLAFGDFERIDSVRTDNFILLQYQKK